MEQISKVETAELGGQEFQLTVLSALLQVMREQERLSSKLARVAERPLQEREVKPSSGEERFAVVQKFFRPVASSTSEEELKEDGDSQRGSRKRVRGRAASNHIRHLGRASQCGVVATQTRESSRIMYYHESKAGGGAVVEEGLPLLEQEEEEDTGGPGGDGRVSQCEYRWKRRIPASRFGEIIQAGGRRKDQEFGDQILSFDFNSDNEASRWGQEHEKDALKKLEQILGVQVEPAKKFVDKENKFLVCVPDGLIDDDKLVEIKCPYKCSAASMEALARGDNNFCLTLTDSGRLKLKENHPYYYQVQGELHVARKEVCYFVVWSPTEFHYQVIERDKHFWCLHMFPLLLDFYRVHILEENWKVEDVAEEELRKRCNDILSRLKTSADQQAMIERATRGQGSNPEWRKERCERLTASNFGRVAKMRPHTSCHQTVVNILYPDCLDNVEAIRYGRENEPRAIETLNSLLEFEGRKVEECGLFVDIEKGFLAGTPDGVVGDTCLVEVKCPMKCLESGMEQLAVTDPNFCLEVFQGELRLKRKHNYFYQIQGQLRVANRASCYFLVWSPTEHHLEVIDFEPDFWEEIEESLEQFYMHCLLPELADPRAPRGLPVREPQYIVQAQNLKSMKI